MFRKRLCFMLGLFLMMSDLLVAQQKANEKYPSLLWEISGNGLTKPSYLFGTMHVSSKLVFHLSDSFYDAIRKVDAVALELNPDLWQGQMVRLDRLKENYASFVQQAGNDYVTENSFRIKNYVDELKSALQTEPAVVNNLLYRSYKTKEDFEEDTFLDLYIFQTGRKLGKKAAGVENYYDAEKIILEAYADMAKEKKKKNSDLDPGFMNQYVEKIQQAYRNGNLDLMDSLDNLVEQSVAFREKFLYKRNEIQANSIDSIIKHTSLFAGVGAAHLPGSRGVIELLRKKGYTVKPVKMAGHHALQKNAIDLLHVPVIFQKKYADDQCFSVDVPGDLYKLRQDYQDLDRRQYADMSNGAYYIVTRIKTHAAFLNQDEKVVLQKVDSVLYENIPGKIISRKAITANGYQGYDISNRTRRGDLQRYQIFVTPFEIIIFKMSGKDNYVAGKEAHRFFSSITLKGRDTRSINFEPPGGGFSMKLPQAPHAYRDTHAPGERWEYESMDKENGDAYLIFKKSIYNFNFIEEDSFDLSLIESSFRNPDYFDKQISRRQTTFNGFPSLEVKEKLKDGSYVNARFFIQGPHYYVVARRSATDNNNDVYLQTFSFKPYRYPQAQQYLDTFLRASVQTSIVPDIDEGMRSLVEQTLDDAANGNNSSGYVSYWQKPKNGLFRSDSTGELISVQVQEFPKYYYIRDSAKYWNDEISAYLNKKDMFLRGKVNYTATGDFFAVDFTLSDTGSCRIIRHKLLLKNNFMYHITTMGDTLNGIGNYSKQFFSSFRPLQTGNPVNIYQDRVPLFFTDLFSADSMLFNKARQSLSNVFYGREGIPFLVDAINKLSLKDKDYYSTKTKLINELGYIRDSSSDILVTHLKNIYTKTRDTSLFQNEVIKALSRLKTKAAYLQLKEYFLQDPPIFENVYDYNTLFNNIRDSLQLGSILFPGLLQLASLDDYKVNITSLLVELVDSGYVNQGMYDQYFPTIYIDAIVALKKQKAKDEKLLQVESKDPGNEETNRLSSYDNDTKTLYNYSVLLMPYYAKRSDVQGFFSRLLRSTDEAVRMNTALLMLRYDKPVADSILLKLAANDKYASSLYSRLKKANKAGRFPSGFRNQLNFTRSSLVALNEYDKLDSIQFLSKQWVTLKQKSGWVYFFRYRIKKTDQWKIGLSGLQPGNLDEVSNDLSILSMTDVKIKEDEPLDEQLNTQLKKVLFGLRKSSRNFFDQDETYNAASDDDYGD